jgi:Tfp pilus assembly protein PilE
MKKRGFTLLETIIYIALIGFLISGSLIVTYELIKSSSLSSGKATVQEEGSFVNRKLSWALYGATTAPTLGGSGCNQTISITKTGGNNPIEFRRDATNSAVEMREGGSGAYTPITSANVLVSCLVFGTLPAVGTGPTGVAATTTINSLTFNVSKYLRK